MCCCCLCFCHWISGIYASVIDTWNKRCWRGWHMIGCPPLFVCRCSCFICSNSYPRFWCFVSKITVRARHEASHITLCDLFLFLFSLIFRLLVFFLLFIQQQRNKPNEAYDEIGYRIEFEYERKHRKISNALREIVRICTQICDRSSALSFSN